ncbi:MAG: triose-phosphate isomerase [Nanoarchaeota archaeon]|nr:triose-phosphate isomerase [Nanoarchaeota archaeon]MBU4086424.1 triose-phosphate isomerase [Nanoarchaeota archaeon]
MIFAINFKTYKQGKDVLKLAREIEKCNMNAIVGVQATDIKEVSENTRLKVYSQHVDYFKKGRETGFVIPEAVKKDGGVGTFLNHSEHKLSFSVLKKTVERCKKIHLKTLVFASSLKEAKKIEKLHPDYLAFEPPELVAGKISVAEAKPELIAKLGKTLRMKFLVGAGIHSEKDIETTARLGGGGVVISSAITTSRNPRKKLKDLQACCPSAIHN